jgi:site-specific recombinase XerD
MTDEIIDIAATDKEKWSTTTTNNSIAASSPIRTRIRGPKRDDKNGLLSLEGREYDNFINSIRSPATRADYEFALKKYMRFLSVKDVRSLVDKDTKRIESSIIEYLVVLKQSGLSSSSQSAYLAAVVSFYTMNDIILNRTKIGKYLGDKTRRYKDRGYTVEEIRKLLQFCDERLKVIVLLLASSGIRLGALPDLKVRNLKKWEKYNIYQIQIYEGTNEESYSFGTPECSIAIDSYLEYRERFGEQIAQNSPLIREQFDRNDSFAIRYPKQLTVKGIGKILSDVLIRAGLCTTKRGTETQKTQGFERKEVPRAHSFRKFANSQMVLANINPIIKEMLLSHQIGLESSYLRPSIESTLQ